MRAGRESFRDLDCTPIHLEHRGLWSSTKDNPARMVCEGWAIGMYLIWFCPCKLGHLAETRPSFLGARVIRTGNEVAVLDTIST